MKIESLQNGSVGDSSGTPQPQEVSTFSSGNECTEDPMGYLEPVKIRITDSYFDNDGINGDLSQIEGSVVDSDFLLDYGKPAINVEKYKIRPNDNKNNRLSALSDIKPNEFTESEYSDGELFRMTEKEKMLHSENEYEELPEAPAPPKPKTESEQNLINKLDDSSTLKRNLLHNVEKPGEPPSLNDLNKDGSKDSSNSSLYMSTPNIKYNTDTLRSEEGNNTLLSQARDSPVKRSLPNIASSSSEGSSRQGSPTLDHGMEKIQKALAKDNGLINLYHGKTDDKRFSKDTENAMKQNQVRYSSSDC